MDIKLKLSYGEATALKELLQTFPDWEDTIEKLNDCIKYYEDEYQRRYGVS